MISSMRDDGNYSFAMYKNLEIKDGKVNMLFSTCKNQICVEHSEIDSTNESIVCLPNRVSIEITGKAGEDDIDAVS